MKRPYMVCYMMTSVDGRIDCEMTARLPGVEDYYALLDELQLRSTVSGRMTAELELALPGKFECKNSTAVGKEIVIKNGNCEAGYEIVIDTKGTLLWKDAREYSKPPLIITSEKVSEEYLAYLDGKGISCIVVGSEKIDLERACKILQETFDIERAGVVGGPTINTAFLDAGLLDEIIILIGAGIDGRAAFPPVFNSKENDRQLTRLKLLEVKQYESDAVMLRYQV